MKLRLITIFCGICMASSVFAQELMVFPNDNQTPDQQDKDQFECYGWAKNQSGFDPMAPPTATEPPPQQEAKKGGAGRGLLRGAALGGIVDGSDGAKTGAAAGALIGGSRRRSQEKQQAQSQQNWEQQQQAIYADNRNRYNRAYAACLEGKNYTVR
jgi:hypothetical protein